MQTKQEIIKSPKVYTVESPKSTIVITEPTRASRRFEDNITVVRIFKPDQERMAAALKYILRLPPKAKVGEENDSVALPLL